MSDANKKVINRNSENVLLFAKYHYGSWNRRTMCANLCAIASEALLLDLDPTIHFDAANIYSNTDGLPVSQHTREAILSLVLRAVEDYLGDDAHPKIARILRQQAPHRDPYLGIISDLLSLLTQLLMKEGEVDLILLPALDEKLVKQLPVSKFVWTNPPTDHAA